MCYMKNRNVQRAAMMEALMFMVILALLIATILCSGCAGARPEYDSNGNIIGVTGYGFLRDLEIEQVKPDGSKFSLKSKSTSADIMRSANEVLGTITATAAKVSP